MALFFISCGCRVEVDAAVDAVEPAGEASLRGGEDESRPSLSPKTSETRGEGDSVDVLRPRPRPRAGFLVGDLLPMAGIVVTR